MIESLESAKAAGHSPERETAEWVGRVSDGIHERLCRAGLVQRWEDAGQGGVTLGQHLERAYHERAPGAVYVVPRARHGSNLGTHAKRLVAKAGAKLWPKLFTNLRGSCSDDLQRRGIAEKAISAWIGNSERIRRRHYHAVRPEDWAAAIGKTVRDSVRPGAFSGVQPLPTPRPAREKSLDVVKDAETQYPRQGSNL